MFRDGWLTINSVPTHVLTWGGWIEDDITSDHILIFLPGSPGITDFYLLFLKTLYTIIGVPIWTINYAGFEPVPDGYDLPPIDENPELYNIRGQIEHKSKFIKTYVPPDKKIILMAHSLGSKFSEQLMKDEEISSRVVQVQLIFPFLHHIAGPRQGRANINLVRQKIVPFFISFTKVFNYFPLFARRAFLTFLIWMRAGWKTGHHDLIREGILKLLTPQVSKAVFSLTQDEMLSTMEVESEVFEKYHDIIYCYYCQRDHWIPLDRYYEMRSHHPKIKCAVMDYKYIHAFVLTLPTEMAVEVSKDVTQLLENKTVH